LSLGITRLRVTRPSNLQRFLLRYLFITIAGVYSTQVLGNMLRDGSLQRYYQYFLEMIDSKWKEHIQEPIEKLYGELFNIIRNREVIVTSEDQKKSQEALDRMLKEFAESKQGIALIAQLSNEFEKTKTDIIGKFNNIPPSEIPTTSTTTAPPPPSSTTTATTPTPAATQTEALDTLMKIYEKELQTPIRGMLYGSLFTAILIQVSPYYDYIYNI
jgi:hypothetical protein